MHLAQIETTLVMQQILQRFRWSIDPSYVMSLDSTALPRPATTFRSAWNASPDSPAPRRTWRSLFS